MMYVVGIKTGNEDLTVIKSCVRLFRRDHRPKFSHKNMGLDVVK